jgi:long-chain fatty acid transport protein
VELVQAIDLSTIPTSAGGPTFGQLGIPKRTEFARATLKGSSTAFGFDLGVHGKLTPVWDVGARFLSQVNFEYDDADATFEQRPTGLILAANNPFGAPANTPVDALLAAQFTGTGALTPQKVKTKIRHPKQVQLGVGYSGFQNTTLSVEYSHVGWKSFDVLPVDFQGGATDRILQEDYRSTTGVRLGAERRLVNGLALRAGLSANVAAAPDETVTPLLPEQDRTLSMLGIGYPFGGRYVIDATYAHIYTPGRRGRLDERAPGSTRDEAIALNNGSYSLSANILSLTLKASF